MGTVEKTIVNEAESLWHGCSVSGDLGDGEKARMVGVA